MARFQAASLCLALALGCGLLAKQASAQSTPIPWPDDAGSHIGIDLFLGTPSALGDVFRTGFPGLSLRYIASPRLEFSLDYAFMAIEYYYPESGSGPWRGPVPWSSIPPAFSSLQSDWIFFQTRHFISPQVWYVAPLDVLGLPAALRLGLGPAISLIIPNESARYYPGLSSAFQQFSKTFDAFLGMSLHLGAEYRLFEVLRLGLDYLFVIDSITSIGGDIGSYGWDYFKRSGNLLVFAGVRL